MAKKSLGQNFLMHRRTAARIADVANITDADVVFEVGPGTGQLTRELLKRAKHVIALEADKDLYEKLLHELAAEITLGKLSLLHGDVREFNIETIPEPYLLVSNIPYYLTGDILRRFLSAKRQPRSMTLLLQKEVVARIARSKKESILSLSVKAYGIPKYEFTVPRGAFIPAPNVDSAVLSIRGISRAQFGSIAEEMLFFELVRSGFAHKRKYLRSNLEGAGLPEDGIPERARAEDLSLAEWLLLAKKPRK